MSKTTTKRQSKQNVPAINVNGEMVEIPFAQLVASEQNVRKQKHDPEAIAELATLIHAQGLINPPTVIEQCVKGKPNGKYEVIAGGRRYAALQLLAKQGHIKSDATVLCVLRSAENATAVSVAENSGRESLHPADEFEAFKLLVDNGKSIEDVAAQFGVAPLVVKQRLALANLAPEFIGYYRAGKVGMDVLKALALTTDHDKQRRVWKEVGSSRSSYVIRRALTESEVRADEKLARFVGAKAYEKAGGQIRRDLFDANQCEGYFTDRALLERLAMEKLQKASDAALADGAAWAEVLPEYESASRANFVGVTQMRKAPTAKQQAKLDALKKEDEALDAKIQKAEDANDDEAVEAAYAEQDEVQAKIDAIEDALLVDDPNQIEKAGVIVTIDYNGKLKVIDRQLRKSDAKVLQNKRASDTVDANNEPAPSISDALASRLSVQRTLALQVEASRQPRIAVAALTAELVAHLFGYSEHVENSLNRVGLTLRVDRPSIPGNDEVEHAAAHVELGLAHDAWGREVAEHVKNGDVFAWLVNADFDRVLALLGYCTARLIDATVHTARLSEVNADAIAPVVGLDMGQWWKATADSYFGALPKARILEELAEICGGEPDASVAKMKKNELAAFAEKAASDAGGWLPSSMRCKAGK